MKYGELGGVWIWKVAIQRGGSGNRIRCWLSKEGDYGIDEYYRHKGPRIEALGGSTSKNEI